MRSFIILKCKKEIAEKAVELSNRRIDVTSRRAPDNPDEPVDIERAREAIPERFLRIIGNAEDLKVKRVMYKEIDTGDIIISETILDIFFNRLDADNKSEFLKFSKKFAKDFFNWAKNHKHLLKEFDLTFNSKNEIIYS